jgi:hypothetical protein
MQIETGFKASHTNILNGIEMGVNKLLHYTNQKDLLYLLSSSVHIEKSLYLFVIYRFPHCCSNHFHEIQHAGREIT